MKKVLGCLMTIIMVCIASITVQAANPKITVSNATAERSQMVYLTVKLSDCAKADTLGISFEYDSSVLKKIASNCSWTNKGAIQDFDIAKDNGVWTSSKVKDLNGEICTLAFRVQSEAPAGDTDVTCTLIVKKGAKEIGTYTAEGTVSVKGDDSETGKQEDDKEQEGTESTKPSTPGNEGNSSNSNLFEDSNKGETSKPVDSNKQETNTNLGTTSTDLKEQQDATEEVENEVAEHQHTDACDHDINEVEEADGNKIRDIIWIVCAVFAGVGIIALIVEIKNREKK